MLVTMQEVWTHYDGIEFKSRSPIGVTFMTIECEDVISTRLTIFLGIQHGTIEELIIYRKKDMQDA